MSNTGLLTQVFAGNYLRVLTVYQTEWGMVGTSENFGHMTSKPNINLSLRCGSHPYLSLTELQHP